MFNSKEKFSNTKAYDKASDDPIFRTRQSLHSKEDKYDPAKYSVHYNTLNEQMEDPISASKSKDKVNNEQLIRKKSSQEKLAEQRQVKSSQSHVKFKAHDTKEQQADTLSEGFGNKTIRENSELQITVDFKENKGLLSIKDQMEEGRLSEYKMEEDNLTCYRFPHLTFCGCQVNCDIAMKDVYPMEVYGGLFVGGLKTAYATKSLLRNGITHVLNLSSNEYTKRTKYFKYLTIDIYDSNDEDIKKHFRITNRFITEALKNKGKILIHDISGRSRAPSFAIAYLINVAKIPLKSCYEMLANLLVDKLEINHYFMKQLEQYDLENLANVGSKRRNV